ncbi:MAG: Ig-like domain-containing protein [Pseudomonadales bacterium]|nr:Ig-like domain-containing protein [Pseudomonadales bacterium]
MKTITAILILGLAGFCGELRAEVCPNTNYTLTTDAEIDLFEQIGCTEITGGLRVGGGEQCVAVNFGGCSGTLTFDTADVTSLNGLRNLQRVGSLSISYNSELRSLSGLSNDLSIRSALWIQHNDNLTSLDELGFITSSNPLGARIENNSSLSNCDALAPALETDLDSESRGIFVSRNAPGCNSVEEILQAVAPPPPPPPPPPEPTLQLILESPAESDTYSGVSTLRGWAVAEEGISKVDIYIDGNFFQSAPYGGKRDDVGSVFPDINNSGESGFALAFNFSDLSAGTHTIRVEAETNSSGGFGGSESRSLSRTSQFQVTKFPSPFLPADQSPDLSGASCVISEQTIHILDTLVDGSVYDVSLQWRTADQGFQIQEIR